MNVFEAITNRRSIRRFLKKEVDDNQIGLMLYMATQAPSAGNAQEWEFVVVKDEEIKKKLAIASLHQGFVKDAPVDIVVCANLDRISTRFGKRGELLYAAQDTANAVILMMLSATAMGLGTCWVGAFDEDRVKTALELPNNLRPMTIVSVGYPDDSPEPPPKLPFERITHLDKYRNKYNIAFITEPGTKTDRYALGKPLGNYIEDYIKNLKKTEKKKKLTFEEFLKRLAKV
jgi:nitroreductase